MLDRMVAEKEVFVLENSKFYLRVLGSSNWCPTPGCDSSSYTVSDKMMIDTGWYSVPNMLNIGLEPLEMPLVLFTHMHADHAMALPQLLLYWRVHNGGNLCPLTLAGPKEMLRDTYLKAFSYAFYDAPDAKPEFGEPTLLELSGGDSFEYRGMKIETMSSLHAVPGLVYRITDPASGHVLCLSGDTAYQSGYDAFFGGCDLLLHEASMGRGPVSPEANAHCKHSSAYEAALVAKEAGAKRLVLTHAPLPNREPALQQAKELLDIPVDWAEPYKIFDI